jgi:hypothetical protein
MKKSISQLPTSTLANTSLATIKLVWKSCNAKTLQLINQKLKSVQVIVLLYNNNLRLTIDICINDNYSTPL